jgi:DNA-directed RNA polymerase subunit M/transcription elongation factor TFIIS
VIEVDRASVTVEGVTTRYRCTACGNLTRFDVVETTSVRSFHHYTVGGELTVEEPEIIAKTVESVTCRWCGHDRGVEVVSEPE